MSVKNKIIKNIAFCNDVFNDFKCIRLLIMLLLIYKATFIQSSYNIIKAPISVVIPAVTTTSVFVTGNNGRAGVIVMV